MIDIHEQIAKHKMSSLTIRKSTSGDRDALWTIMEPIIRAGETYALPTDWDKDIALNYWCDPTHTVFVAEDSETMSIVGTYFLHANQKGNGNHVANCGYMTLSNVTGKGIARTMCAHSLQIAKERGFAAMQYNFVIQSNERAVRLWQFMGFEIIGRIPRGFRHPTLGEVDIFIMHQFL